MAVFERPPSSRDVGYVSKERERGGCVRARERQGRPLMRETHKVRRGRCRDFDPFRDFYFADPELTFCESRSFRKVAKHVVLSPTCTLPRDNDQSRRNFVSPPRSTPPMTTPRYPHLWHTFEIAKVRLVEHTAANPACLRWGCGCGWCLEWRRWPRRSHENLRTRDTRPPP